MKNLQDVHNDYMKGKFEPKNFSWEWEDTITGGFSIYIVKPDGKNKYAYDGNKDREGFVKKIEKMFGVKIKKRKK